MTENRDISEIFDNDAQSLSRIAKSLNTTSDVLLSELLAREPDQQSGVFKETINNLRDLIRKADAIVVTAEQSLILPESLRQDEPF
jgi:DNA-binding transcriptional regulator LsrR (DeoR family)